MSVVPHPTPLFLFFLFLFSSSLSLCLCPLPLYLSVLVGIEPRALNILTNATLNHTPSHLCFTANSETKSY